MSRAGLSPAHPPVPKKPPITPKPTVIKSPVVAPKKHGSSNGKGPVPKPKPRTSQRTSNGSPLPPPPRYSHPDSQPSEEKNNEVKEVVSGTPPGDLITPEPRDESQNIDAVVDESQEKSSQENLQEISQDTLLKDETQKKPSEEEGSEDAKSLSQEKLNEDVTEITNGQPESPQVADQSKELQTPVKRPERTPPKPAPRTPNPNPPPRRAKSVFDPGPQKTPPAKKEVSISKSNGYLSMKDQKSSSQIEEQLDESPAEDLPTIPKRTKRLSRDVTSSPVVITESASKLDSSIESRSNKKITQTAATRSPVSSPVRPPLPTRKKPLIECTSPAVDEESSPPLIPRRTDTNGNPARIRAKSEFIKNKPARPPPPVKPPLTVALSTNSATPPPPTHPKPTRNAKSQFIPNEAPLRRFTTVDIDIGEKSNPQVPPRTRRVKSFEKNLDVGEASSTDDLATKNTSFDSVTDSETATPPEGGTTNDTSTHQVPPITPRKPAPKLTRSLTEPEQDGPRKRSPRPATGPLRKAPPIPLKPVHTSPAGNAKVETDSSTPKSSLFPTRTPPQSPKSPSFKSHNFSPKHRPRLPPPPPPPVVRTNSQDLPEPPRRITSRSKSLDTTLTSESSNYDPNGNRISPGTSVENENAKNSSKSMSPVEGDPFCNRDSQDSSSSSAVQSTSDDKSMSSVSRNSVMSEDDEYVLPDPDPQSPPLSPQKISHQMEDQIYMNKQVASVRPSRREAPPRPVKPVSPRQSSLQTPPTSPTRTCPVTPNSFKRGSPGTCSNKEKRTPPAKPVRRTPSINSDVSNDGYEDMSKGSSLASSLGIGPQLDDLYSVPRACEHTLHESGGCSCAQQYADQSSGEEDEGSPSDEEEGYEKFDSDGSATRLQQPSPDVGNITKAFLVAKEIRDSEKVFVDVLKLLNKDFRQAIDDAGTKEGRAVIEQLLLQQILGHLPQLQMFNEELLEDLDERVDNWSDNPSISSIFLKKGPYLKLYSSYIRDFEKITTVFDEACGRFPLFGAAVRDFELSERCQNLAIKHYMLKPIQRIPQYKMLLTDYLKQLQPDTTEHAETSAALNIVSEVANHANECMRQGDNFGKLLQIQHSLIGNHEIVKPGRVFIKEGELLKLSRKVMQPRKFYLMNDILLYTTPFPPGQYKLNNVLSLAGMRVNKPQLEDFKNEFNIISVQRSFTLSANTPEERDEWIQALTSTITDYATKRSSFSVLQPQLIEGDTSSLGRKAPIWIPDSRVTMCMICTCEFTVTWRRHHCRACGKVVCGNCSMNKVPLMYLSQKTARVCEECFNVLAIAECEEEDGSVKDRPKFKSKRKRSLKETKRPAALKEVSANESDTNMSGYLHVKRKKDWKRMWFVLKGKVLYTYKASEDVAALESMPLLGYEIKVAPEYFEGIEPGLVLQLYHQGRVMSVFRTESKTAAEKWAYAMVDATTL